MSIAQERYIERNACMEIRRTWPHVQTLKCKETGYPDRQMLLGWGRHIWIEFKTPEGRLSKRQKIVHAQLKAKGDSVHVCTCTRDAIAVVAAALRAIQAPGADRKRDSRPAKAGSVREAGRREDRSNADRAE